MWKKAIAKQSTVTAREAAEVANLLEKAEYAAALYQETAAIYRYLHG
ncbi:hypothetical protein [Streptococcus cuniculi]|nr:hypothetical protein [Streptococcus cuniculi]